MFSRRVEIPCRLEEGVLRQHLRRMFVRRAFVMKVKLEVAALLVPKLDVGGLIGGRIKQLIEANNGTAYTGVELTGCENDLDTNTIYNMQY